MSNKPGGGRHVKIEILTTDVSDESLAQLLGYLGALKVNPPSSGGAKHSGGAKPRQQPAPGMHKDEPSFIVQARAEELDVDMAVLEPYRDASKTFKTKSDVDYQWFKNMPESLWQTGIDPNAQAVQPPPQPPPVAAIPPLKGDCEVPF